MQNMPWHFSNFPISLIFQLTSAFLFSSYPLVLSRLWWKVSFHSSSRCPTLDPMSFVSALICRDGAGITGRSRAVSENISKQGFCMNNDNSSNIRYLLCENEVAWQKYERPSLLAWLVEIQWDWEVSKVIREESLDGCFNTLFCLLVLLNYPKGWENKYDNRNGIVNK